MTAASRPRRTVRQKATGAARALAAPRVVVEAVFPEVDGGRFPAKRTAGEHVAVRAHVFADGHDAIGGVVCFRRTGERDWRETPVRATGNDEFIGGFEAEGPGMMEYTVEAWIDGFTTWRSDLQQRVNAGWDVSSELLAGAELLRAAAARATRPDSATLRFAAQRLGNTTVDLETRVQAALAEELAECAARWPDRSAATRYQTLELLVDHELSRRRRAAARPGRDGLRRALPAADPPNRRDQPQRTREPPPDGARRSRESVGYWLSRRRSHRGAP
jgi:starch synthase (maltosyl-transferring)